MRAEDYITNVLHMEIERPREYGNVSCALKRYTSGRNTFKIPFSLKLDDPKTQRLIWHEVGHYLDDAHYFGGHTSRSSIIQAGKLSREADELLKTHRKYLQENRDRTIFTMHFNYKGRKHKSLESLLADPEIPEGFKLQCQKSVWRAQFQEEDYLAQPVEVYADGFAEYMMNPEKMKKEHPDLAGIFEYAYKTGPSRAAPVLEDGTYSSVKDFLEDNRAKIRREAIARLHKAKYSPAGLGGLR